MNAPKILQFRVDSETFGSRAHLIGSSSSGGQHSTTEGNKNELYSLCRRLCLFFSQTRWRSLLLLTGAREATAAINPPRLLKPLRTASERPAYEVALGRRGTICWRGSAGKQMMVWRSVIHTHTRSGKAQAVFGGRRRIRCYCDELNTLVPLCHSKTDKVTTLHLTTSYLRHIHRTHGNTISEVRWWRSLYYKGIIWPNSGSMKDS